MTRLAAPLPTPRAASRHPSSVEDWAHRALLAASRAGHTLLLSIPAPRVRLEALLRINGSWPALLWESPGQREFSGLGVASEVRPHGAGRFHQVRQAAERIMADVRSVSFNGAPPIARLVGGFAFQAGDACQPPWNDFGDGWFVLPRLRYDLHDFGPRLTLTVPAEQTRSARHRRVALEQLLAARDALAERQPLAWPAVSTSPVVRPAATTEQSWNERVDAIVSRISAGQFEKVVAARRSVLELEPPPDPLTVLTRLGEQASGCIRFAFRRSDTVFVGATPERLAAQTGCEVRTEALAGTIRSDGTRAAHRLLHSRKDRAEHDYVLQQLLRQLEPVCQIVQLGPSPAIHALRHLLHLRSPIVARRHQPGHILQLVELLHPTPAVGGVPTEAAVRWIAEHEPDPRGWYAGPVGWFDPHGDGEFAVALRSGVIQGPLAHLYAGAGIVRDSDPQDEYAETTLKLAALRGALGVGA
jgi:isochorismate synthase